MNVHSHKKWDTASLARKQYIEIHVLKMVECSKAKYILSLLLLCKKQNILYLHPASSFKIYLYMT